MEAVLSDDSMQGMKRSARFSVALLLLAVLGTLVSAPALSQPEDEDSLRKPLGIQSAPGRPFVQEPDARISNRAAAALVKQRYGNARILGISLMDNQGPPIYRVRTLSPDGVVKSVFVDGESGEVFE